MDIISRRDKEKLLREADIIAAAEKIFYRKGFASSSMDEVAKEAQFTKRTLYQYFTSKEDLYLAVALKGFKQLIACFKDAVSKGTTGFEKIRLSGLAYYQFYKNFPDTFRLLNYCRFINASEEHGSRYQEMKLLDASMYQMFINAFEQGQTDGSIRTDMDPRKGAYFVVSVSVGLLNLLSETGKTFEQHYAIDQEDFILFSLDMLCDAIKRPA